MGSRKPAQDKQSTAGVGAAVRDIGHALINLPGPASRSGERSDGLEGFARTFLLAAFRMSQSDRGDLAEWYATGTDPRSPERAQAKVEAASIAWFAGLVLPVDHPVWTDVEESRCRVRGRIGCWWGSRRSHGGRRVMGGAGRGSGVDVGFGVAGCVGGAVGGGGGGVRVGPVSPRVGGWAIAGIG